MRNKIVETAKKYGLDCVGFTSAKPFNEIEKTNFNTAVVFLFPYYVGEKEGANISKYAWGLDYHSVIKNMLTKIGMEVNLKDFKVFSDIGPNIERTLAQNAGLGFKGLNSMVINEKYGSYFFIGYIVCYEKMDFDEANTSTCINCKKCVNACPGGAIKEGFSIDTKKCLSAITQKKSNLEKFEIKLLNKSNCIFGCDICQDVCPHNKKAQFTQIGEFMENLETKITLSDIENLSNKEFLKKYKMRAFTWRGKKVLERNLQYISNFLSK